MKARIIMLTPGAFNSDLVFYTVFKYLQKQKEKCFHVPRDRLTLQCGQCLKQNKVFLWLKINSNTMPMCFLMSPFTLLTHNTLKWLAKLLYVWTPQSNKIIRIPEQTVGTRTTRARFEPCVLHQLSQSDDVHPALNTEHGTQKYPISNVYTLWV